MVGGLCFAKRLEWKSDQNKLSKYCFMLLDTPNGRYMFACIHVGVRVCMYVWMFVYGLSWDKTEGVVKVPCFFLWTARWCYDPISFTNTMANMMEWWCAKSYWRKYEIRVHCACNSSILTYVIYISLHCKLPMLCEYSFEDADWKLFWRRKFTQNKLVCQTISISGCVVKPFRRRKELNMEIV